METLKKKLSKELARLDQLMIELLKYPELTPENSKKLNNKFRLEWNFHSNHIEGNTLTHGQTELLLFRGKATGDHEKQEYDEMEAHDLAIELIKKWAGNHGREITEVDLRELNGILLVRPFWKEAITSDGQPTRKKIIPGEYKSSPNSVRLKSGQIHDYASPEETSALMRDLMKWYLNQKDLHPIIKAAITHHRLTQIHPFDDGNGRVARLWANYILLQAGYPPLIIRTKNKEVYLSGLEKADVDEVEPLVSFFCKELLWSIDLAMKAARGESLDEPEDLDKRIALLDRKIANSKSEEASVERSGSIIQKLIADSFIPLDSSIEAKIHKVTGWFNKSNIFLSVNNRSIEYASTVDFELATMLDELGEESIYSIAFTHRFEGFKKAGTDAFNVTIELTVEFSQWNYIIKVDRRDIEEHKGFYHKQLSDEEIERIASIFANNLISQVESRVKALNRKEK